jgi:hypothetical protein
VLCRDEDGQTLRDSPSVGQNRICTQRKKRFLRESVPGEEAKEGRLSSCYRVFIVWLGLGNRPEALAQPGIGGSPEVRGPRCRRGKCHFSPQAEMAAFRDIARTMEVVSTQFGGRGAAVNLLARERPRTEPAGTWRGPSVDDLLPREGA